MKNFSIKCFNNKKQEIGDQVVSMSDKEIDSHKISFTDKKGSPLFVIDTDSGELILDNSSGDFDSISTDRPMAKIKVKNVKIDYNENITFTLDGSKTTYRISGNCFEQKAGTKFEVVKSYNAPFDIILSSTLFKDIENNAITVNGFPFQIINALSQEDEKNLSVKKFTSKNGLLNLIKHNNQIYIARGHKFIPISIASQHYYKIGDQSVLGVTLGTAKGVSGKQKSGIAFKLSEEELESVAMFLNDSLDKVKFNTKKDLDKNDIDYSKVTKQSDLTKIIQNESTTDKGEPVLSTPKEPKEIPVAVEEIPVKLEELPKDETEKPAKEELSELKIAESESTAKDKPVVVDTDKTETSTEAASKTADKTETTDTPATKTETTDGTPADKTEATVASKDKTSDSATTDETASHADKSDTKSKTADPKAPDKDDKDKGSKDGKEDKESKDGKGDKEKKDEKKDAIKKSIPINSILAIASLLAFIFTGFPIFIVFAPAFLGLDFGAITYLVVENTKVNNKDKSEKKSKDKSKGSKDKSKDKTKDKSKEKLKESTPELEDATGDATKGKKSKKIKDASLLRARCAIDKIHYLSDRVKYKAKDVATAVKDTAVKVGSKTKEVAHKATTKVKDIFKRKPKDEEDVDEKSTDEITIDEKVVDEKPVSTTTAVELHATSKPKTIEVNKDMTEDTTKNQYLFKKYDYEKTQLEAKAALQTISSSNTQLANEVNTKMDALDAKFDEEITDTDLSPEELKEKLEKRKKLKEAWDQQKIMLTERFTQIMSDYEDAKVETKIKKQVEAKQVLTDTKSVISKLFEKLASLFKSKETDNTSEL